MLGLISSSYLIAREHQSFPVKVSLMVWRKNRDSESLKRSRVEVWGEKSASKKHFMCLQPFQEASRVGGKGTRDAYMYDIV